MQFRRLDYAEGTPVEELGAAALDDLLERGDLAAWAPLARAVRADPHGPLSETVLALCEAHAMYGTSALWRSWISALRANGSRRNEAGSLADLRRKRGLTQEEVGRRMGMSQSDVSKLERRSDVRLSTLGAYVRSTGGTLELRARYAGDAPPIDLRLG